MFTIQQTKFWFKIIHTLVAFSFYYTEIVHVELDRNPVDLYNSTVCFLLAIAHYFGYFLDSYTEW